MMVLEGGLNQWLEANRKDEKLQIFENGRTILKLKKSFKNFQKISKNSTEKTVIEFRPIDEIFKNFMDCRL